MWHHDVTNPRTCQFSAVCLTVFPFEFRPRTFTIEFYGKNSIISELMILECSFPLRDRVSKRKRKVEGKGRGKERKRKRKKEERKGGREIGSEALAETEKIANAPAGIPWQQRSRARLPIPKYAVFARTFDCFAQLLSTFRKKFFAHQ